MDARLSGQAAAFWVTMREAGHLARIFVIAVGVLTGSVAKIGGSQR